MSREGWLVALGACLLLLIVPLAMCAGLSSDVPPPVAAQRPSNLGETEAESHGDWAETAEVAADEEPEPAEPDTEPEPTGKRVVFGVVTNAAGNPIEGAEVSLESDTSIGAETDDEGAFELAGVSTEPLVLVVTAFGYAETKADVAAGDASARAEQDVVLAPGDGVTGEVLDPDGHPVRDALVGCAGPNAAAPKKTDALGRFTLPKTAAGCDAVAKHDQFADSAVVELKLGPDNLLALRPQASIHGVVVDANESPYRGFVLSLYSFEPADGQAKMRPYRQTFAHPQGRFQVTQLPAGTYVFSVGLRGRTGLKTQAIRVKAGEQLTGVKIVIE